MARTTAMSLASGMYCCQKVDTPSWFLGQLHARPAIIKTESQDLESMSHVVSHLHERFGSLHRSQSLPRLQRAFWPVQLASLGDEYPWVEKEGLKLIFDQVNEVCNIE